MNTTGRITTTNCETCFDTGTIDTGGREIACTSCSPKYHPSSVTIEFFDGRYVVWDRSQDVFGCGYASSKDKAEAVRFRNLRQGVIKAALTRRANKARREARLINPVK